MRKGRALMPLVLVAAFGFVLEYLGTHGKCYLYGDIYLAKVLLIPPCIVAMWGVLGWLAWKMYKRRGLAAGMATPLALDFLVIEPLAFYTGLWTWMNTQTPRVWFSTIGNYVVYVLVAVFAIWIFGWFEKRSRKEVVQRAGEIREIMARDNREENKENVAMTSIRHGKQDRSAADIVWKKTPDDTASVTVFVEAPAEGRWQPGFLTRKFLERLRRRIAWLAHTWQRRDKS